tara:strand:+ start:248 stop:1222 length:975 start_codon:yes stop_codon:yes gene_type:complete
LAGLEPTAAEQIFFAEAQPLGFILFARNIGAPTQVRELVGRLRACIGRADAPVLIDQEGGRVARLRPPHWHELPAAARVAALPHRTARDAAWLCGRLIAHDCAALGIDVVCAPTLDVLAPDVATQVIGDRSYGQDPKTVAELGRAMADGLQAGGVLPVAKHMPGHGRAHVDSHHELPTVNASLQSLTEVDFEPFRALSDLPLAMTAHIDFTAIDPGVAATCSSKVIETVVRQQIGFQGFLFSDDLSMQALGGSIGERAVRSLEAGCDAVLHCNGDMAEMREVADATGPLSEAAWMRWRRIQRPQAQPFDAAAGAARLASLMSGA